MRARPCPARPEGARSARPGCHARRRPEAPARRRGDRRLHPATPAAGGCPRGCPDGSARESSGAVLAAGRIARGGGGVHGRERPPRGGTIGHGPGRGRPMARATDCVRPELRPRGARWDQDASARCYSPAATADIPTAPIPPPALPSLRAPNPRSAPHPGIGASRQYVARLPVAYPDHPRTWWTIRGHCDLGTGPDRTVARHGEYAVTSRHPPAVA